MQLGELITVLENTDPDLILPDGFAHPHSWRGHYTQLAFEPARNVTVAAMLRDAQSADGATYQGWKGGDYIMTRHSDVYLAVRGDVGQELGPLLLRLMIERGYKPAAERPVTDEITVNGVRITPVDYIVSVIPDGWTGDSGYLWTIHVQYMQRRGEPGTWRVVKDPNSSFPEVLSASSTWDLEGSDERDSRNWLKEHRFTLDEALRLATAAAPVMQVSTRFGMLTAADAIAREQADQ